MANMQLQFATYFDASDQASISRVSGGIHPPADDFPGRRIGHVVGPAAWNRAVAFFEGTAVPEPATAWLLVMGAPLVCGWLRGQRV